MPEACARAAALVRALARRGVVPPSALEWHESLGSTNDRLKALARDGAPEWSLVLADRQSVGRGRAGRTWTSPPGGLYMSLLLRPQADGLSLLPLAAGVAAAEAAAEAGLEVRLKWPNDVVVPEADQSTTGGRKLAGILAEAVSGAAGPAFVVLGIGMNVRRSEAPSGEEARRMAWLDEAGTAVGVVETAAAVRQRMGVWYDALASSPSAVVAAWRQRAVSWWGEIVEARLGRETVRGRLVELDADGSLVLETAGGLTRLLSGDVSRVRRDG